MTDDRASELAQQVQHAVLADIAYRIASGQVGPTNQSMPGIVWKQHIAAALRAHAEEATQEHSDALAAAFAEQLIISVEEASAHWKRETETGAAMLAEIHRGLGIVRGDKPGVSAQDVLDRVARLVEEARREEREACAKILDDRAAQMTAKRLSYVAGGIESTEGTWYRARWVEACDGAAAIRARGENG